MRLRVERRFAAVHGGKLWDSDDPAAIAPWAAAADEPVYVRVGVFQVAKGGASAVRAGSFRIPRQENPAEYVGKVAQAMEEGAREAVEGAPLRAGIRSGPMDISTFTAKRRLSRGRRGNDL